MSNSRQQTINDRIVAESYLQLSRCEKCFVDAYLDPNLIETKTCMATKQNAFASFLFAFNKHQKVDECMRITYKVYNPISKGYEYSDDYVDGCILGITITNNKLYRQLVRQANMIHSKCQKAINDILRKRHESDDESLKFELKEAIAHSAFNGDGYKDKNANRAMLVDILGLKQSSPTTEINIYDVVGKNVIQKMQESTGDRDDAPIVPTLDDISLDDE